MPRKAAQGRLSVGSLFSGLVIICALAFFSDCFAWYTESKVRPLSDFIRAVFSDKVDAGAIFAATYGADKVPTPDTATVALPTELGSAVAPVAKVASAAATYGFYFPVFNEVAGTLNVVAMARRHYPDSPIHLLQDGGHTDFGLVCKLPKYNCSFEVAEAENGRWNPHPWLERMLKVAKRLATTFIIYLEPDVVVRHRHVEEPKHDAGGMYDHYNSQTKGETMTYLVRRGRERQPCFELQWRHFGLAGGSYFRTEAVIDAFDPRNVVRLDFPGMEKTEGHKVYSSDFAMLAAFSSRGWTVYPWEEASQNYDNVPSDEGSRQEFMRQHPAWRPQAAFEHAHKEHYGSPLPAEEQGMIRKLPAMGPALNCHACVWRTGQNLENQLLHPAKLPRPPNASDHFNPEELKRLSLWNPCRETPPTTLRPKAAPSATPEPIAATSTTLKPKRPPQGKVKAYAESLLAAGRECKKQGENFGFVASVELCDQLVVNNKRCGPGFMFSPKHPDWACRCCLPGGEDDGPKHPEWNVYNATSEPTPQIEMSPEALMLSEIQRLEMEVNLEDVGVDEGPQVADTPAPVLVPLPTTAGKGYTPAIHEPSRECASQAQDLGDISTAKECDEITASNDACGGHFMFSFSHPSWHCRCCSREGASGGPASDDWYVLRVQSQMPEARRPPPPKPFDPGAGLPVVDGPRPSWLVKEDGLVIDARKPSGVGGGVLILQAVLMDAHSEWGKKQGSRPRWLRAILASNREHARRFGHAMVLRWRPSHPQLTHWQLRYCRDKKKSDAKCVKDNERESFNWEKHLMMAEYLNSPQNFSHVFMLDADAALVRPDHDTLGLMSQMLEDEGKDIFLSDEDWLKHGAGRINGGLVYVKSTNFTRALFNDTFGAHRIGRSVEWRIGVKIQCTSNEQICLNALYNGAGKDVFRPHALMASGKRFNRGGCVLHACGDGGMTDESMKELGMADPDLEIMHFMGGSKSAAGKALCEGQHDLTGGGPEGYGCRESAL